MWEQIFRNDGVQRKRSYILSNERLLRSQNWPEDVSFIEEGGVYSGFGLTSPARNQGRHFSFLWL
jgi:hypothetical protein